jgi:hypothetical protein
VLKKSAKQKPVDRARKLPDLGFDKISSAFELTDLPGFLVTCYSVDLELLRSFGECRATFFDITRWSPAI